MPKFAIDFEEIQTSAHRNIEEQNKVFGSSEIIVCYLIIILTHSIIIIFVIKFSSRHEIGKKMFEKKILKLFTQSPTRQGTNDKYQVNTFHRSPICAKMFRPLYYLVATVIHIKSPRSQTCVYKYMFFTIQRRLLGGKI